MEKQKDILNELKKQAPFLSGIKKENPFKTPGNYFRKLPDRVLAGLPKHGAPVSIMEKLEKSILSWVDLLIQPRYAITSAFAIVIIAAGTYLFKIQQNIPTDSLQGLASLSDEEINSYITGNLDEYELSAFNGQGNFTTKQFSAKEISNDELNNYIINNFDEQNLEEEFL